MSTAEREWLCILPWVSVQINQDGAVIPCCRTDQKYLYGHLSTDALSETWNSSNMRALRKAMLNGEKPATCGDCHAVQAATGTSDRHDFNRRYADAFDRVEKTREDGSIEESSLLHMGLRFSNVCNLRCRTCSPENSTSWHSDAKALDRWIPKSLKLNPRPTVEDYLADLEVHVPTVREVYFAGGEPLLDEGHYRFLEMLIASGRTDVKLIYNTNFSTLTFGRWSALELWSKFDKVAIGASFDGVGAHAELVRKGCDWQTIKLNRLKVAMLPNVEFSVFCTVSVLNCFHLPDVLDEWIERKMIWTTNTLVFNMVRDPEWYSLDILNDDERRLLRSKYESYLGSLENRLSREMFHDIRTRLMAILESYQGPSKSELRTRFVDVTRKLDALRSESFAALTPELSNLF